MSSLTRRLPESHLRHSNLELGIPTEPPASQMSADFGSTTVTGNTTMPNSDPGDRSTGELSGGLVSRHDQRQRTVGHQVSGSCRSRRHSGRNGAFFLKRGIVRRLDETDGRTGSDSTSEAKNSNTQNTSGWLRSREPVDCQLAMLLYRRRAMPMRSGPDSFFRAGRIDALERARPENRIERSISAGPDRGAARPCQTCRRFEAIVKDRELTRVRLMLYDGSREGFHSRLR